MKTDTDVFAEKALENVQELHEEADRWHRWSAALYDLASQLLTERELGRYLALTCENPDWKPGPPSTRVDISEADIAAAPQEGEQDDGGR